MMIDPREPLVVETHDALELWPRCEIASLRPDHPDRIQVVHADGTLAHRPGPLPEGPWVQANGALVAPQHLRDQTDPAGFIYPDAPVTPIPLDEEEIIPEIGCRPGDVLFLQCADDKAWWITDRGRRPAGVSAASAATLHPTLAPAGRGTYVNLRRLRAIRADQHVFHLTLDTGAPLSMSWGAREGLQRALGLPQLYHLEPYVPALNRERLRDWPCELATASSEQLRKWFTEPRPLIANLIWQTLRYRQQGRSPDYGTDHRPFWYVPIVATLYRAGMLPAGAERWVPPDDLEEVERGHPTADLYRLFQEALGTLVGEDRLLTYAELGFHDPRPDLRSIGAARPEIVVFAEKISLLEAVEAIQGMGVSTIISGGLPSLLSTEYFAAALRKRTNRAVRLIGYVDFDPGGWVAANAFAQQLRRYGVECSEPDFLVRPERFGLDELALYAIPIPSPTPQVAGKVAAWIGASGGVDGKALGIHADHLRPISRVTDAVRALLPP